MTKEELEKEAEEYVKQNYCEVCIMADDCKCGCIDCFTVQAYLAGAEPREKRIAELEAEVKEWKDKADLWCKTANLKDHNIMINKELEKENAELKKLKRECETSLCRAEYQYNYEQLTKAKELLERLLITSCNSDVLNLLPNCSEVLRVRVEAEQFLNSEGK